MKEKFYNSLQIREVFHLEFLRWMGRKIGGKSYALKGGANMRFFFNSFRYSEDMDVDVFDLDKDKLKSNVMNILLLPSFQDTLKSFGVERVIPPDISRAKQTDTTQRFKVHLIVFSGEDLFTKIEFSRRGVKGKVIVSPVSDNILRMYKLPPLLVPHYSIESAVVQKVIALATRAVLQARDIFDLYILSSQFDGLSDEEIKLINKGNLFHACANVFEINFKEFRDTVVSYLPVEDQAVYSNAPSWEEVQLKVSHFLEQMSQLL